jgi:soluble lytic murein transglycosylase-like protein
MFLLLSTHLANAAPDKNTISDKALRLAMLDLDFHKVNKSKIKKKQVRSVRKQHLISKRRDQVGQGNQRYSTNCLTWSAHQINRKAKRFEKAITDYSRQYRVDKNLVKAVITVESCFRVKAKSHAGAQGLMQLIPATARRFGVRKSYNSRQNIRGGIKYLKFLKARYRGDLKKILAAYNAGEGAVDKYKGIPPYKETQKYVKKVLKIYARLKPKTRRVSKVYGVTKKGKKPGRHGWQYNRKLAPHLYKK